MAEEYNGKVDMLSVATINDVCKEAIDIKCSGGCEEKDIYWFMKQLDNELDRENAIKMAAMLLVYCDRCLKV